MKNRILTFTIGVLTGAIIITIGFLLYSKSTNKIPNGMMIPIEGNEQMQPFNENMGEPPAKPEGDFQGNT